MQELNFKYPINNLQQIFVEKGLELLYKGTLDSYRLRLHNPKTAIQELILVTQQVRDNILKRNEYVSKVALEVKTFLKSETQGLDFQTVSKEYYVRLLISSNKPENFDKLIQASKLILRDNVNYSASLLDTLKEEMDNYTDGNSFNKSRFVSYCAFSHTELIYKGFSKQYVYHFFRTIFVHTGNEEMLFDERYLIWKELFNQNPRNYTVIYKILSDRFQFRELNEIDSSYIQINKHFRLALPMNISNSVKDFLERNKEDKLIGIEVTAYDHYKAIETSRSKLAKDLDIYHLGFSGINNRIDSNAAVINFINPEKASTPPSNYQIDGYTRGNREILGNLLSKFRSLETNNVALDSINKLASGFRYLRMGFEAPELEAKFLNYWIGLEYVFTSFLSHQSTVDRIQTYFPICHSVIYIRRNLYDFHKTIARLGIEDKVDNYNDDLIYLSSHNTYEQVKTNTPNLLFNWRATELQKWTEDPSSIKRKLHEHSENLRWSISRLYRIRNEIVHNAATKNNIQVNVSHIKYYLTFILNSILDFLSNSPIDTNEDDIVTIEDYFITQDILLGYLKEKTISEYLKVRNPLEILH